MEELTQDGAQLARTMLMASAQLAESMARVQAQRAWMAQSRSTAQAAQAQEQIAAERDAARMIFRPLAHDRYWQDAPQLDRVVYAYMTAASWAEHDPEARVTMQLIKNHAEARWGREVGDAMRVPCEPHPGQDRDYDNAPMTAKQRKYLSEIGADLDDEMTKAQTSRVIKDRLEAHSHCRSQDSVQARQSAEVVDTAQTQRGPRLADERFDRAVGSVICSDELSIDALANLTERRADPKLGTGVIPSVYVHADEADLTAKGVPADSQAARLESAPGVSRPISSSLQDSGCDGRSLRTTRHSVSLHQSLTQDVNLHLS